MIEFKPKLKELRQKLEFTQKQFAQELGISVSHYRDLETKKYPVTENIQHKIVEY